MADPINTLSAIDWKAASAPVSSAELEKIVPQVNAKQAVYRGPVGTVGLQQADITRLAEISKYAVAILMLVICPATLLVGAVIGAVRPQTVVDIARSVKEFLANTKVEPQAAVGIALVTLVVVPYLVSNLMALSLGTYGGAYLRAKHAEQPAQQFITTQPPKKSFVSKLSSTPTVEEVA